MDLADATDDVTYITQVSYHVCEHHMLAIGMHLDCLDNVFHCAKWFVSKVSDNELATFMIILVPYLSHFFLFLLFYFFFI